MLRIKGYKGRALTDRLIQLSKTPPLIRRMPFGKYAGERFENIARKDFGYIQWAIRTLEPDIVTALQYWR